MIQEYIQEFMISLGIALEIYQGHQVESLYFTGDRKVNRGFL